ncbi:single-stranded-DNA-specific exonuclease RecJ [uncultured Agitococcus sp.]|uniref:single-stranded-DNA-specific exonuclease RecJ n=1 Tax=uncultured Agitococcus sp. TaxID=1506599 RepID=UPI0026227D65|nr:single-stranded-DNA-specific exonuclease RecJ [uncultured Agitococcus sp.]
MTKLIKQRPIPPISDSLQHLHPVLARVYAARGIQHPQQVQHQLKTLARPEQLLGMPQALALLTQALQQQQRILIVGDFDADGATSTSVVVLALRAMGANSVDYLVPNRFKFGYGLTPEIVEVALNEKNPQLIITVDNGISSREGVERAKQAGVKVLITDHHLTGKQLPDADAIINPNQANCPFPSKSIAGVGVAFYVMAALCTHLKSIGWFNNRPMPRMSDFLDIVALGTVADVVALDDNNRILVAQGLERIRAGQCREGIKALLAVAKRERETIQAEDLAFAVAPRLNAAGRLDDMSHGIECLLADSPILAQQYAQELDDLNIERRSIEGDMQQQALATMQQLNFNEENLPPAIVLFDASWHQGVIGIVAGRLKEKFHRPSIVFAPVDEQSDLIKGSARSIQGIHIRDAIELVTVRHAGLVSYFGGHAMAAGMTIPRANFQAFQQAFSQVIAEQATEEHLTATILTDGELAAQDINLELAQLLRHSGPWGQAFPEPIFEGEFELRDFTVLKEKHLKWLLKHPVTGEDLEAIAFNVDMRQWSAQTQKLFLAYRLDVNTFRNKSRLQLKVDYWRVVE